MTLIGVVSAIVLLQVRLFVHESVILIPQNVELCPTNIFTETSALSLSMHEVQLTANVQDDGRTNNTL
jgi:hypothetical protein